eukprot:1150543-Pelagomonas_calceolata.AAC.4
MPPYLVDGQFTHTHAHICVHAGSGVRGGRQSASKGSRGGGSKGGARKSGAGALTFVPALCAVPDLLCVPFGWSGQSGWPWKRRHRGGTPTAADHQQWAREEVSLFWTGSGFGMGGHVPRTSSQHHGCLP